MRFVRVEGRLYDPADYIERLPELIADLPPGAARFAGDPEHYDFFGLRCVKDLAIVEWDHDEKRVAARIRFAGNPWKHDEDLIIDYVGVTELTIVVGAETRPTPDGIGPVMLDEVLPAEVGCSHEIAGLHGTLRIWCADLEASWHRVPRPDDPPPGSWAPELALGDRWNWLGRRLDGVWVVGVPHRRAEPADDAMEYLLVVLERPWPSVVQQWRTLPASAPALDEIVGHGLISGTWRARLAMDWLEDGYPVTNVLPALAVAKEDRRLGQHERHRALRIWLANRNPSA